MFVVFPGERHPRNQAHPIGYEGHGYVYLATALSLAWLFLSFVSYPHQGLFALLLCMYPSWPPTPASASQRHGPSCLAHGWYCSHFGLAPRPCPGPGPG